MTEEANHQPPISLFLKVWGLLFVLSFFSYLVDYYQLEGALRWSLVLLFMTLKAWAILSVFMHVKWERPSLKLLLIGPTSVMFVLVAIMVFEGSHTYATRLAFFSF